MAADESQRLLQELAAAIQAGRPVAMATVVATRRSVPRHAGTKMLVYADGSVSGTVGGGEMESRVIEAARASLRTGTTQLLSYDLLDPGGGDPGVCGGHVEIYLEPSMPPPTVLIAGAGHVGKAVAELAHWLGFRTVITDDRADEVSEEAVPTADVRVAGSIDDALSQLSDVASAAVVLVSRSVEYDVAALQAVLARKPRYVGVMGSERRWATTRRHVEEAGMASSALDRVAAPIGHEIGAETVEEIAVSIMAEVIGVFRTEERG